MYVLLKDLNYSKKFWDVSIKKGHLFHFRSERWVKPEKEGTRVESKSVWLKQ